MCRKFTKKSAKKTHPFWAGWRVQGTTTPVGVDRADQHHSGGPRHHRPGRLGRAARAAGHIPRQEEEGGPAQRLREPEGREDKAPEVAVAQPARLRLWEPERERLSGSR